MKRSRLSFAVIKIGTRRSFYFRFQRKGGATCSTQRLDACSCIQCLPFPRSSFNGKEDVHEVASYIVLISLKRYTKISSAS